MRARKFDVQRPSTLRGAAGRGGLVASADMRCHPFRVVWSRQRVELSHFFHRRFELSYFIQIPKAIRLKVNKCRALSSPPPPKRPCGIRAYKTPARPRWGLCFCVSGGRILSPNVCRVRISHLSGVAMVKVLRAPRQRAERVARDLPCRYRQSANRCAGGDPLCQNPWRQASALAPLAHGVVDVATHEDPAIALANKIARMACDDGQGRTLQRTGNALKPTRVYTIRTHPPTIS
jgi:hypothetical protein